jgi:RNA 2',3'-cyclic 3'-phosphodiesterase
VRLFVALEIPAAVRENLATLMKHLRPLAPQSRWVRPENLHVTLKFIGETPSEKLDAIRAALAAVRSSRAVTIDFLGLGFFPNEKHPRVFWAGMEASPNLKTLAADIEAATKKLGILPEERPFSPHLTLARFEPPRLPEKLRGAIQENAAREFGSLAAQEFHLIESKLKPSGAEYTTLESFPFVRRRPSGGCTRFPSRLC